MIKLSQKNMSATLTGRMVSWAIHTTSSCKKIYDVRLFFDEMKESYFTMEFLLTSRLQNKLKLTTIFYSHIKALCHRQSTVIKRKPC